MEKVQYHYYPYMSDYPSHYKIRACSTLEKHRESQGDSKGVAGHSDINVYESSIRKTLNKSGVHKRKSRRKQFIFRRHVAVHLIFASNYQDDPAGYLNTGTFNY